jgi:hypothetical protein
MLNYQRVIHWRNRFPGLTVCWNGNASRFSIFSPVCALRKHRNNICPIDRQVVYEQSWIHEWPARSEPSWKSSKIASNKPVETELCDLITVTGPKSKGWSFYFVMFPNDSSDFGSIPYIHIYIPWYFGGYTHVYSVFTIFREILVEPCWTLFPGYFGSNAVGKAASRPRWLAERSTLAP